MKYAHSPGVRSAKIVVASILLPLILGCIWGCASPAPPRPPSLNLPEPVRDLSAERVGDDVVLHWTASDKTTDNLPAKGTVTAELCRLIPPSASCNSIRRIPVTPGPVTVNDALPPELAAGPPTLLAYRLRLLNAGGRAAPSGPQVLVAAGSAPPAIEGLRAQPTPRGIQITWLPTHTESEAPATVQLSRLPLTPALQNTPAPPPPAAKPQGSKSLLHPTAAPRSVPGPAAASILRSPQQTGAQGLADGLIDTTAERDQPYRYTAQRIRTVTLEGHTFELRSPVSSAVTVILRDIFPPQTPIGLEAAPNPGPKPSIDLSWSVVPDTDLAGYLVFRRALSQTAGQQTPGPSVPAPWRQLTPTPIPAPGYSDDTAVTGQRYAYHVTAVDRTGNQSPPSQDVQETLREQ